MRFGSLFSGIGGFDLGFERAGMECAWQCEIDKHCQDILTQHFGVKIYDDVRTITAGNTEPVDVICGGFPCQDVSIAGKRAGFAGERSGLWTEFARIIGELKPGWVVIENVPGLLSSNRGYDFKTVLDQMVEFGYGVCWRIFNAEYFGVAQRRRRVFIVGSLGNGRSAEVLFEREGVRWNPPPRGKEGQGTARTIAPSLTASQYKKLDHQGIESGQYLGFDLAQITSKLNYSNPKPGDAQPPINTFAQGMVAFDIHQNDDHRKDRPEGGLYVNETDKSLTLSTGEGKSKTVIADTYRMTAFGQYSDDASAGALKTRDYKDATDLIAFSTEQTPKFANDISLTLTKNSPTGGGHPMSVMQYSGVRRLTPTECERLQGFPDGWTDGQSDSTRYKQLGNAVAVPVAEWIGKRIEVFG